MSMMMSMMMSMTSCTSSDFMAGGGAVGCAGGGAAGAGNKVFYPMVSLKSLIRLAVEKSDGFAQKSGKT